MSRKREPSQRTPKRTSYPDIVYPIRKGEWNEELRYSLRSLRHIPHNRVFLVGFKPSWVKRDTGQGEGVAYFPREQKESKYLNGTRNLIVANELFTDLSDPFLLMNDDMYIMQPMKEIPILNLGLMGEVIDRYRKNFHTGAYWRGMGDTYVLLKSLGIGAPISFEVHAPMPISRAHLEDAWAKGKHLPILHIRSMMGNLAGYQGETVSDFKVYRGRTTEYSSWPFLSSNDDMHLTPLGDLLRERFPDKSPYESD